MNKPKNQLSQAAQNAAQAKAAGKPIAKPAPHYRALTRARNWKPIFLKSLSLIPSVRRAAESAGVAPKTAYHHFHRDLEFAERWRLALQESADRLEEACWRRATDGWLEPVYSKTREGDPVLVGHKLQFSDRLAEVLLRGHKPGLYGKQSLELSGPGGVPLPPPVAAQVVVNIPHNGREPYTPPKPSDIVQITSPGATPIPVLPSAPQEPPHPEKDKQANLPKEPRQVEAKPELRTPLDWKAYEKEKAQREFDRIDSENARVIERLRQEGRLNENRDGFGYTPLGG
jgi:hypothetical protein